MIRDYLDKTIWIFNHPKPETIPSYYVSGLMPSHYMGIKKVIFLENHSPQDLIDHFKPKCIILSKAFSTNISLIAKLATKKGIKVISIFDDWSFDNTIRSKLNLPIAKNSDYIITKTIFASREIKHHTDLDCEIIPDPIRFNKHDIFNDIDEPLNTCWFGMHTNHSSILEELSSIEKIGIKINLSIISNSSSEIINYYKNSNFKNLKIFFTKWNNKSNLDIIKNEIVLLPYPNDKKRIVKSSNRIIDSLNLGRFTIISKVDQFQEFEKFTYFGNISTGLLWLLDNKQKAKQITQDGQNYVSENYSLENICKIWIKLFHKLIEKN